MVGAIFGVHVPHAVGQQARRTAQAGIMRALPGKDGRNPFGQRITVKGKTAQPPAFKAGCRDQRVLAALGGWQLFIQQALTQAVNARHKLVGL